MMGFVSFCGLGLEDVHVPTFWLPLYCLADDGPVSLPFLDAQSLTPPGSECFPNSKAWGRGFTWDFAPSRKSGTCDDVPHKKVCVCINVCVPICALHVCMYSAHTNLHIYRNIYIHVYDVYVYRTDHIISGAILSPTEASHLPLSGGAVSLQCLAENKQPPKAAQLWKKQLCTCGKSIK